MKRKKMWIQKTGIKKHPGKLRSQLGIHAGRKIPQKLLTEIAGAKIGTKVRGHKVTGLLKKRAVLARSLRKFR